MECSCLHCRGYVRDLEPDHPSDLAPNVDFLEQAVIQEPPTLSVQDIWNRMDPKWIADNLYQEPVNGFDPRSGDPLDLSNAPYFTAPGWTTLQEFEDRWVWSWTPNTSKKPPPIPSGQVETKKLNPKSATLLRRAGDLFQGDQKVVKFVTLTYRVGVCHVESKRHLDNFLKALARECPGSDYFWVSELQKRGVIHYHVCIQTEWIDVAWLRSTWRRIIDQEVEPDIENVQNPGHYMSKYMRKDGSILTSDPITGKRCGFSRNLRARLRPKSVCREPMSWDEARGLFETFPERHEIKYTTRHGVITKPDKMS